MILQILQNATMMEVIVVDLMSTQDFVLIVYAPHMIPVMVHLSWSQTDTAMMKWTMQAATLMGVTVVQPVSTLTNVQSVCVMKEVHPQLIHHVIILLLLSSWALTSILTEYQYTYKVRISCFFLDLLCNFLVKIKKKNLTPKTWKKLPQ